ncbi:RNA polymerase sigma factor [Streptomyces sp. NPDC058459]|uniref:RNA polymerase sigma factor n=1 Tax=Streptomyces sp. NPDC058459 TaxID=3346508 RepID=UPI00364A8867
MSSQANATIITPEAVTELAALAALGDRDAFATLYNGLQPLVFSYLVKRTRHRPTAEDLTSETFARALAGIHRFSERPASGGYLGWLYTIARNLHVDHVKRAATRMEIPLVMEQGVIDVDRSAEASALRHLDAIDAAETVEWAMRHLTVPQRECMRLLVAELPLAEVAARLGKGIGAVKTLQYRAVANMRSALTTEDVAA